MRKTTSILLSFCVLALGACDHYSEKMASMPEVSPALIEPAAGVASGFETAAPYVNEKTFADYLKEGYMVQARLEQGSYDYKAAKYCTEKAYALSNGQLVSPSSVRGLDISSEKQNVLSKAREELINAIKTKNIPENRFSLADAQVNFDCWVDHATENKRNSPCEAGFFRAMNSLTEPDFSEKKYLLSFDAPSGQLSESDRATMREILDYYQSNAARIYQIQIHGENSQTAQEKMEAIQSVLKYNGIPADKIAPTFKATSDVSKEQSVPLSATGFDIIIQQKPLPSRSPSMEARIFEEEHSKTVLQEQGSFY